MAAGDKPNPGNDETAWLIIGAGVIAVFILAWIFLREPFVMAWFGLVWLKLQAYDLLIGLGPGGMNELDKVSSYLGGYADASRITLGSFWGTIDIVAGQYRWVFFLILVGIAGFLWTRTQKATEAIRTMDLEKFIRYQTTFWNTSAVAVGFHPEDGNPNMRAQLQPYDYMKERGIPEAYDGRSLSLEARERAMEAFADDLGPQWRGVDKAPTYVRAIIALYVTHVANLKDKSNKLKPTIGRQLRDAISPIMVFEKDPKKRDAKIEAMIAPYLSNPQIMEPFEKLAEGHGYQVTVLIRGFEWAKKMGVFASAEMLWVKMIDRPTWYALNNVGRVAFHIEGAGAQSHYYYEKASRKPLLEAKVDNAVVGLEEYLDEMGYIN